MKQSIKSYDLIVKNKDGFQRWWQSGSPWIWLTASAVTICLMMVFGLLSLIAIKGMGHFWPSNVTQLQYTPPDVEPMKLVGEIVETETVNAKRLEEAGIKVDPKIEFYTRLKLKLGNKDVTGEDFKEGIVTTWVSAQSEPKNITVLERYEYGNFYGVLSNIKQGENVVFDAKTSQNQANVFEKLQENIAKTEAIHGQIHALENGEMGELNYQKDQIRLALRRLVLVKRANNEAEVARLTAAEKRLDQQYEVLSEKVAKLNENLNQYEAIFLLANGEEKAINISKIVRAYQPNQMGLLGKIGFYFEKLWEFVSAPPREANTEGGIFPAIFGTVLMVLLMSVIVTPFGVIAALYLREYATQGFVTRSIRIAVNNLAGVPSVVFGIFGLGFFVYGVGAGLDKIFYPEYAPSPVFGTPGILWASLTLSLLTLPVVIVATEEGLSRIPRSLREASLALGATKAETLWRVILPMTSPAIMTGLILALARAAGEVAPLMLVGVVKLAPSLPLDSYFPFLHLDRKFMHLGFHIYDVGFQSPNIDAARPLVYATAFLLVLVIVALNLTAVRIRNRLRERYKSME